MLPDPKLNLGEHTFIRTLPCLPLEAHLRVIFAQHSVEADLKLFCDLGIASKRNATPIHLTTYSSTTSTRWALVLNLMRSRRVIYQASTSHLCTLLDMDFRKFYFLRSSLYRERYREMPETLRRRWWRPS